VLLLVCDPKSSSSNVFLSLLIREYEVGSTCGVEETAFKALLLFIAIYHLSLLSISAESEKSVYDYGDDTTDGKDFIEVDTCAWPYPSAT
jgi:hypothetical protein